MVIFPVMLLAMFNLQAQKRKLLWEKFRKEAKLKRMNDDFQRRYQFMLFDGDDIQPKNKSWKEKPNASS